MAAISATTLSPSLRDVQIPPISRFVNFGRFPFGRRCCGAPRAVRGWCDRGLRLCRNCRKQQPTTTSPQPYEEWGARELQDALQVGRNLGQRHEFLGHAAPRFLKAWGLAWSPSYSAPRACSEARPQAPVIIGYPSAQFYVMSLKISGLQRIAWLIHSDTANSFGYPGRTVTRYVI